MKTFKLEVWLRDNWLTGSIAENDSAFMSIIRIQTDQYENPDDKMIKYAFDYSLSLLKSNFKDVQTTETSASVTYDQGDVKSEPEHIITAEKIHQYLSECGYRRKSFLS